jgi:hypothetical protein
MRGRQFHFLATMTIIWVAARLGIVTHILPPNPVGKPMPVTAQKRILPSQLEDPEPGPIWFEQHHRYRKTDMAVALVGKAVLLERGFEIREGVNLDPVAEFGVVSSGPMNWPEPLRTSKPLPSGVTFYAYSFFRTRASQGAISTVGQYGGSQSGFVVAVPLLAPQDGPSEAKIALQMRGATAHDDLDEREFSAGLRWRPIKKIPLSLTLERRFRNDRKDSFGAYLAGGEAFDLPFQSRLESYAQAGYITGKAGGPFFDFSARAERKLGASPLSAGFGLWGGGQTGIFRIDAGPTITHSFEIADTPFRVSADWRTRIAGDAAPASGPAVTLSTSF